MPPEIDFQSLVPGGSVQDEELYWEEGFYVDGSPISEEELDRLAIDHFDMLYDAAYQKMVGVADFIFD